MINDPAIDEIRQIRHKISAEFDHDPKKLYSYYKQVEDKLRSTGEYIFLDNGPKMVKSSLHPSLRSE
jgi:hypothetical protein